MVQLDLVSLFITSWFTFSSSVLSKSEELAVIRFVPFLLCTRTIMVSGLLLPLVINLIEGGARKHASREIPFFSFRSSFDWAFSLTFSVLQQTKMSSQEQLVSDEY